MQRAGRAGTAKVLKKLLGNAAWKCKCPRLKNWFEKTHGIEDPGHHWFVQAWKSPHASPSCPLRPRVAGEELWEGKDVGLTVEDMDFLCAADPW